MSTPNPYMRPETTRRQADHRADPSRVIISGIDIGIWDLVKFLVKLTLASIPTLLILLILFSGAISWLGIFLHK